MVYILLVPLTNNYCTHANHVMDSVFNLDMQMKKT